MMGYSAGLERDHASYVIAILVVTALAAAGS